MRSNERAFRGWRFAPLVALLAAGCSDAAIAVVGAGAERGDVQVDGPLSSVGAWRYYDGVRLLECSVRLTAYADGETGSARWVEGVLDFYDLASGRYLTSDYLLAPDLAHFWGSDIIRGGERRSSRLLRYNSFAAFRVAFTFRYRLEGTGRYAQARHTFDCR